MTPKKIPKLRRRYILENIASKGINEIAKACDVSEKTIDRDIAKLKATGEWYTWIEYELLRLHKREDIDSVTKYKEMSKLYAKGITERRQVETIGTHILNVVYSEGMKSESRDEPTD